MLVADKVTGGGVHIQEIQVSTKLETRHQGGGNYLWCDGHVEWLSYADAVALPADVW